MQRPRKSEKHAHIIKSANQPYLRAGLMFISYRASAANGFLKWSRSQAQKSSNDNDQPGGSTPVSLADPLTSDSDPDVSMGLGRTATL